MALSFVFTNPLEDEKSKVSEEKKKRKIKRDEYRDGHCVNGG